MTRVAIVGSGIAGMGAAHALHPHCEIYLFEKNAYTGGHTHTVCVDEQGESVPIDTGFMVFTPQTYPNLTQLFEQLRVPVKPTDMSFSVQYVPTGLEWNGAGFNALFGQRKNLVNIRFWRLVKQLARFSQSAPTLLTDSTFATMDLEGFCAQYGYDEDFLTLFLLPMGSAIWSTAPKRMRQFPLQTLVRFFVRHQFLGMYNHLQWYTVDGGAKVYAERLTQPFRERIHHNCPVEKITTETDSVRLHFADGSSAAFDKVILACHADEALAMLEAPSDLQHRLLQPFQYETNHTLLHTDHSVLPKNRRCQAAWNYKLSLFEGELKASTHYWMNRLQGVSNTTNYFVSLNAAHEINPATVLKEMIYHHPLFTLEAIAAQKELPQLNCVSPNQQVYFCGSYFHYGFHEDALTAALDASAQLLKGLAPR